MSALGGLASRALLAILKIDCSRMWVELVVSGKIWRNSIGEGQVIGRANGNVDIDPEVVYISFDLYRGRRTSTAGQKNLDGAYGGDCVDHLVTRDQRR
jgi:hypothetical protein